MTDSEVTLSTKYNPSSKHHHDHIQSTMLV